MKKFSLICATVLALFWSAPGWAVTVSVGGVDYDVTTKTGTFANLFNAPADPLSGQVWWGNQTLAVAFATQLGAQLGLLNNGTTEGPYFAWDEATTPNLSTYSAAFFDCPGTDPTSSNCQIGTSTFGLQATTSVFAVATRLDPVPLPAGAVLIVTAMGALAAVRRRSRKAA